VCARQELDFSHIDVPTPPLRDPEIRRVDGSVQSINHATEARVACSVTQWRAAVTLCKVHDNIPCCSLPAIGL